MQFGWTSPVPVLAEGGFNPLAFDPSGYLLTVITFVVLAALLLKFAWNPILNALDAREKRIHEAVDAAANAKADAERLLAANKKQAADAERAVAQRLEESRAIAAKQAQEILDRARDDADKERERAKREIDLEKQRAIGELRAEAVKLSRLVAEKVLDREINEADHRRLADQVLASVSSVK